MSEFHLALPFLLFHMTLDQIVQICEARVERNEAMKKHSEKPAPAAESAPVSTLSFEDMRRVMGA